MVTASVRDLRYNFKRIFDWIRDGKKIAITFRNREIAFLIPVKSPKKSLQWPDFNARLKKNFPRGVKGKPLSQIIDEQRGEEP